MMFGFLLPIDTTNVFVVIVAWNYEEHRNAIVFAHVVNHFGRLLNYISIILRQRCNFCFIHSTVANAFFCHCVPHSISIFGLLVMNHIDFVNERLTFFDTFMIRWYCELILIKLMVAQHFNDGIFRNVHAFYYFSEISIQTIWIPKQMVALILWEPSICRRLFLMN